MTAPTDEIRFEIKDSIAYVTVDRPARLNAIDGPALERLNGIWAEIEGNPTIRAVVVTGAGERAFCVGADMAQGAVELTGLEYWASMDPNGFGGLSLRRTLDIPVIARVNGYALGGGMEMVLGCDIVVAAEHAEFGLPEAKVGRLPLDGGIVSLVRRVPHVQAMGMLLTGRRATASEMRQIGLVSQVVPYEDLDAAVDEWLQMILSCAPTSVRAIKQVVQRTEHLTAAEARTTALPALMAALDSEDSAEGVRAFQEKRAPVWPGR